MLHIYILRFIWVLYPVIFFFLEWIIFICKCLVFCLRLCMEGSGWSLCWDVLLWKGGRLKYGTLPVSGCYCGKKLIGYMICLKRDQSDNFFPLLFPIFLTQMSELELSGLYSAKNKATTTTNPWLNIVRSKMSNKLFTIRSIACILKIDRINFQFVLTLICRPRLMCVYK